MNKENRVLAYEQATELNDSDLLAVSGGSAKFSVNNITKLTGSMPPFDFDIIQVWD